MESNSSQEILAELTPYLLDSHGYPWRHRDFSQQGMFRSDLPMVQRNCDQTKPYSHGDPLQYLDWRAFARTDTLLIRQDIQSARVRVGIVIDARASMFWPKPDLKLGGMKFSTACRIGLHLAAQHVQAGQAVFLSFVLQTGEAKEGEIVSLQHAIELYERFQPEFSLSQWETFWASAGKSPNLVYFISDLLAQPTAFPPLSTYGFVLHLLHAQELDLSWTKNTICYYDETDKKEWNGAEIQKNQTYVHNWVETKKYDYDSHPYRYGFFTDQSSVAEYMSFLRG